MTFASGINGMNQGHMLADCAAYGRQKLSQKKNPKKLACKYAYVSYYHGQSSVMKL